MYFDIQAGSGPHIGWPKKIYDQFLRLFTGRGVRKVGATITLAYFTGPSSFGLPN